MRNIIRSRGTMAAEAGKVPSPRGTLPASCAAFSAGYSVLIAF
jgi:hypothetical protein